jgi:hypothetical protein
MGINIASTISEVAAWWGAILATIVLFWDIYKWRTSGPLISLSCSANSQIVGGHQNEKKIFIVVKARNTGGSSTTITNLTLKYYKTFAHALFRIPDEQSVVINPGLPYPLPHTLVAGSIWDGMINQTKKIEEQAVHGYLYCELHYSNSAHPKRARIKIART